MNETKSAGNFVKEFCDFCEKFTRLTLFIVFIFYFFIFYSGLQTTTQKLLFLSKQSGRLIGHLRYIVLQALPF